LLKNRTSGGEEFITVRGHMFLDDLTATRKNVQEFNIHQAGRLPLRFLGDVYVL
jgi:hypothetical protein